MRKIIIIGILFLISLVVLVFVLVVPSERPLKVETFKNDILPKNRLAISDLERNKIYLIDPITEKVSKQIKITSPGALAVVKNKLICEAYVPRRDPVFPWEGSAKYALIDGRKIYYHYAPLGGADYLYDKNLGQIYIGEVGYFVKASFNILTQKKSEFTANFLNLGKYKNEYYLAAYREDKPEVLLIKDASSYGFLSSLLKRFDAEKEIKLPSSIKTAAFGEKVLAVALKDRIVVLQMPSFKVLKTIRLTNPPNMDYDQPLRLNNKRAYLAVRPNDLLEVDLSNNKVRTLNQAVKPAIFIGNRLYGYYNQGNTSYLAVVNLQIFKLIKKVQLESIPKKQFFAERKLFFLNDSIEASENTLYIFDTKTNQLRTKTIGKLLRDIAYYQ